MRIAAAASATNPSAPLKPTLLTGPKPKRRVAPASASVPEQDDPPARRGDGREPIPRERDGNCLQPAAGARLRDKDGGEADPQLGAPPRRQREPRAAHVSGAVHAELERELSAAPPRGFARALRDHPRNPVPADDHLPAREAEARER